MTFTFKTTSLPQNWGQFSQTDRVLQLMTEVQRKMATTHEQKESQHESQRIVLLEDEVLQSCFMEGF